MKRHIVRINIASRRGDIWVVTADMFLYSESR